MIIRILVVFLLCFIVPGIAMAWGDVQYHPVSSIERHEIYSGLSFVKPQSGEDFIDHNGFFLKYALYFPEFSNLLPESYKKFFTPGFVMGINFLRSAYLKENMCETNHPGTYYLGLKGKLPYFDVFHPFIEGGLARSLCHVDFSFIGKTQIKLSHYFAFGLFLSLKILDKISIYSLDQDYGINDMGFKLECSRYYFKGQQGQSFGFCQFGFQFSF